MHKKHRRIPSENLVPRLTEKQIAAATERVFAEMAESQSHFQTAPEVPPRPEHTFKTSRTSRKSNQTEYVSISPYKTPKRKHSSDKTPFQTPQFGSPPITFSPGGLDIFDPKQASTTATPSGMLATQIESFGFNPAYNSPSSNSPSSAFKKTRMDLMDVNPPYLAVRGFDPNEEPTEVPPTAPPTKKPKTTKKNNSKKGGSRKTLKNTTSEAKEKFKQLIEKIQQILHTKGNEDKKIQELVELYTSNEYGNITQETALELAKMKVNQNATRSKYGYKNNQNTRPLTPIYLKRRSTKRSPVPPKVPPRNLPSIELTNEDLLGESENNNNLYNNNNNSNKKSISNRKSNKTRKSTMRRGKTSTYV